MKINVIGAGNIGGTLGSKWAAWGHEVIFNVRDPQAMKVQSLLAKAGQKATAVSLYASVETADVVLFAIPGSIMPETVTQLGSRLDRKILIDTTNNVGRSPMHSLDLLRQNTKGSAIFRAFSNLGWENFADPVIAGEQIDLFYCGDAGDGQKAVDTLIADIGLRPIYVGGVDQAGIVDALTRLWFTLALQQGRGRHLAFKLLTE